MLSQLCQFTKSLLPSRRSFLAMLLFWAGGTLTGMPAHALLKMDAKVVDAALVYGMRHQQETLNNVLGANWIEGDNGALLNVYSPFMMLAVKAARSSGLSDNPGVADLQQARKRFGREVSYYSDTKNKQQVKFAVSFYGDTPTFATTYKARIIGYGRGKEFELKPARQIPDLKADPVRGRQKTNGAYEAINAYYFNMADLEDLQEFRLEMASPQGPPLMFPMKNDRLY